MTSTVTVKSPYDHHVIKEIPLIDEKTAFAKLEQAQQVFLDRKQHLTAEQRIAILEKTLAIMTERQDDLAKAAAEEGGKPLIDSRIEAARAIQGIKVTIEHMSQMTGTEIAMGLNAASQNRMAYTFREPRGVVLAISAFNHPLNLIIHQVIPAVAVGCPVLVKPATSTPISCESVVNILHEAGLPESWCQMVLCPVDVAEKLVSDQRVQFLSFIGSGKVGWYLRSKLAPGASCTLEHGGAAPVIMAEYADLDDALPLLVKGGFYHAGQVCVSVQRVFADKKTAKNLAQNIAEEAKKLNVGDPVAEDTDVGPLISPQEVERVDEWVQAAIKAGAECLTGGNKISDTCYEPTVLLDPPADAQVTTHEIFGPVVCVYSYDDFDEAITRANALPFTFQASIFTKHLDRALAGVKQLKANTVLVNDHTAFRVDWMPFAGSEESGLGVGGIPYTMHDMTREKLFVMRSTEL